MDSPAARRRLQAVSPAPTGGWATSRGLPIPLTSLVGRGHEITSFSAFLRDPTVRLATFTGVGGVGKTRLALRVAADLLAEGCFADGAAFVDLSSTRDPSLISPVVARSLGVLGVGQEPAGTPPHDGRRDRLELRAPRPG
jgi:non-specific serine/threonine protein kinase